LRRFHHPTPSVAVNTSLLIQLLPFPSPRFRRLADVSYQIRTSQKCYHFVEDQRNDIRRPCTFLTSEIRGSNSSDDNNSDILDYDAMHIGVSEGPAVSIFRALHKESSGLP